MQFFLHPTTCIQHNRGNYLVKNLISGETCTISKLEELNVNNAELIEKGIFIDIKDKSKIAKEMFDYLERQFQKSTDDIGYIETTSVCPYTCVMCPKATEKIERDYVNMPMELYMKIVDQLPEGGHLALHLFGDPLCDADIIERIKYANKKGIKPSFSTNLISLHRLTKACLPEIQLGSITISMDAIDAVSMTAIRGKTNTELFEKNMMYLEELADILGSVPYADSILLQAISMKGNEKAKSYLIELEKKHEKVVFIEKPFINFPGVDSSVFKQETVYENEEWIWLYDLVGKKKPYRCLKPWNKKEAGVMSDGRYVPCCMCYNETFHIGDLNKESLSEVLSGEQYHEFRIRIFFGGDCGNICNKCFENGAVKVHKSIDRAELSHIEEFCIDKW